MPWPFIMLSPYGHRSVLRSTVCKCDFCKSVLLAGCGSSSHKCYGDRATIVRFMRSNTVIWPQGDREATVQWLYGTPLLLRQPQVRRTTAVRSPYGFRKDAVRFSRHRGRVKTVCHLTASYGGLTVHLQCGFGVAALWFLKKFNFKQKIARLAMTLRRA